MATKKMTGRETAASQLRAERGAQAKTLLENPVLIEVLQHLRDAAMNRFHLSTSPDEAWRAKLEFSVLDQIAGQLLTYIKVGRDAAVSLRAVEDGSLESHNADSISAKELAEYLQRAHAARSAYTAGNSGASGEAS